MSFIGLNIAAQGVKNTPLLLQHMRTLQPAWVVVMDGVELAKQIKDASPNTNVIIRVGKPDGYWIKGEPEDFLSFMRREIAGGDLWVYCDNETGLNVEWNTRLIELNAKSSDPLKLVILNLSVGTPQPDEWLNPKMVNLLKLADKYRAWLVISLHEYFNAVPTSGFMGGLPDHAGVPPGMSGGENLIPFENWPKADRLKNLTLWHCGRFNFLIRHCKALGINPPRLVLTEFGADDVEFKAWNETLQKTPPYLSIRGFRSLSNQWKQWFSQWREDEAYFNMLVYLYENVYNNSSVEGGCIFCYGHIDEKWEQFDVEGQSDLMRLIAQYAPSKPPVIVPNKPTPAPVPVPVPKPASAGTGKRVEAMSGFNIRTGPGTYPLVNSDLFGTTGDSGDLLRIFPAAQRKLENGETWVYAVIMTGRNAPREGWLLYSDFEYLDRDTTAEVPKVETETSETPVIKPVESLQAYSIKQVIFLLPSIADRLMAAGVPLEAIA